MRVVAAYNLKNVELMAIVDKSDPYVRLSLGSQEHKTHTIDNDLNPRWNSHAFDFEIRYMQKERLTLEVFDSNSMRPDTFMGRLVLPVDRLCARPNESLPIRERLQDVSQGEIELEVRFDPDSQLSSRGTVGALSQTRVVPNPNAKNKERFHTGELDRQSFASGGSVPDRQRANSNSSLTSGDLQRQASHSAKSGKAHKLGTIGVVEVKVVAAYNLVNTDSGILGDVSDPYVKVRLGKTEHRTKTIDNDLNPRWDAAPFHFDVTDMEDVLHVEVWDEDTFTADDFLGRVDVPLQILLAMAGQQLPLLDDLQDIAHGEIELLLTYKPL